MKNLGEENDSYLFIAIHIIFKQKATTPHDLTPADEK